MGDPITITVEIGSTLRTYILARTNAPKAYDYEGTTIELYDGSYTPAGGEKVIERYVLIDADRLEYQRPRYQSGLHTCQTEDLLMDASDIERQLWDRVYNLRMSAALVRPELS